MSPAERQRFMERIELLDPHLAERIRNAGGIHAYAERTIRYVASHPRLKRDLERANAERTG